MFTNRASLDVTAGDALRVAIVGYGGLATRVHGPNLQRHRHLRVEAVADSNQRALQNARDAFPSAQMFGSWRLMRTALDQGAAEVDAVLDFGAIDQRPEVLEWLLSARLPGYLEKPIGFHYPRDLCTSAHGVGAPKELIQVGFNFRYSKGLPHVDAPVESTLTLIQSPLRVSEDCLRSLVFDLGIHAVDYLLWRYRADRLFAARVFHETGNARLMFQLTDGVGRLHTVHVANAGPRMHRMTTFQDGIVTDWDRFGASQLATVDSGRHWRAEALARGGRAISAAALGLARRQLTRSLDPSYRLALHDFVNYVRLGSSTPSRPTLRDYDRAAAVCEAICELAGKHS